MLVPVLLVGGVGTRLWPASRHSRPKQFLPLSGTGRSLFVDTLERLNGLEELAEPIVIGADEFRFMIAEQLQLAGFGGRILGVYLGTIIVGSIGFGMAFDWIITMQSVDSTMTHEHGAAWWEVASTVVLVALMAWFFIQDTGRWVRSRGANLSEGTSVDVAVSGMTCGGCVNKLDGALRKMNGAEHVSVQLNPQRAVVGGRVTEADVKATIRAAGFETP